jgi:hypothetical protein
VLADLKQFYVNLISGKLAPDALRFMLIMCFYIALSLGHRNRLLTVIEYSAKDVNQIKSVSLEWKLEI